MMTPIHAESPRQMTDARSGQQPGPGRRSGRLIPVDISAVQLVAAGSREDDLSVTRYPAGDEVVDVRHPHPRILECGHRLGEAVGQGVRWQLELDVVDAEVPCNGAGEVALVHDPVVADAFEIEDAGVRAHRGIEPECRGTERGRVDAAR